MRQSVSSAAAECGESVSRADSTTDQCVVTNQASEAGGAVLSGTHSSRGKVRLAQFCLGDVSGGAFVGLEPRSSGNKPLQRAEGMERQLEGQEHEFRDQIHRLGLRLAQGAGDFVFEKLGHRPQDGAEDRADQRHVAQEPGIDAGVDLAIKVQRAAILQPHPGGADVHILGADDAVGDDEGAGAGAGPAVAQAGHHAVEHVREDAEDGDLPNKPVAQIHVAVAVPGLHIGGARRS